MEDRRANVVTSYRVVGMTCEHCERAVTAELSRLEGVTAVRVDVAAGTVAVGSDRPLHLDDVAAAVDEAGYELTS